MNLTNFSESCCNLSYLNICTKKELFQELISTISFFNNVCLTLLRSPVASGKLSKWCSATSLCSFGSLPPINAHYVSLRKTDLNFYKKEKKRDRCQAHITKLDLRLWYFQFSIYYKCFKVFTCHNSMQYKTKSKMKYMLKCH